MSNSVASTYFFPMNVPKIESLLLSLKLVTHSLDEVCRSSVQTLMFFQTSNKTAEIESHTISYRCKVRDDL